MKKTVRFRGTSSVQTCYVLDNIMPEVPVFADAQTLAVHFIGYNPPAIGAIPLIRRDADDYGGGFSTYTPPAGKEGRMVIAEDTNATTPGRRIYVYSGGAWRYVALS